MVRVPVKEPNGKVVSRANKIMGPRESPLYTNGRTQDLIHLTVSIFLTVQKTESSAEIEQKPEVKEFWVGEGIMITCDKVQYSDDSYQTEKSYVQSVFL